jgi:SAM-dependent methyltransferase
VDPEDIFEKLVALAEEETRFFSDIWRRSRDEFGLVWVEEIVDNVSRIFDSEESDGWRAAIHGYAAFALDAMRSQKFFETNGRYRWTTLQDIEERYYENSDYMLNNYLPGMVLSHYLWPHHFRLLSFFRTEVLTNLKAAPSVFYDVGIGTGLYSRELLRAFPQVQGKGFDISPYPIEFTRRLLRGFGLEERYDTVLENIFTTDLPTTSADFLVSQEVLEHLEDPERFIGILHSLTKPGGRAYITAAINAGHSDHIYLFRSPEEVQDMLTKAGWRILKHRAEYSYEGKPTEVTPCVAGFFCERAPEGEISVG